MDDFTHAYKETSILAKFNTKNYFVGIIYVIYGNLSTL